VNTLLCLLSRVCLFMLIIGIFTLCALSLTDMVAIEPRVSRWLTIPMNVAMVCLIWILFDAMMDNDLWKTEEEEN
jgi:hypothetical protein